MSYLDQCRFCDDGQHDKCTGTVTIMDQDGPNAYVCQCVCRRYEAQCLACPKWRSGGHVYHQEAEKAFDHHVQVTHRPKHIIVQPKRTALHADKEGEG